MTQHSSPRQIASKVFIEGLPKAERDKKLEQLAFTYATWFFELLVEFEGKPLVLEPFQIDYLIDPNPLKITNKTRQAGGSMQLAMAKFFKAYTTPNYRCDIVSINLKEATDKIRYIRNFYETLPKKYQIPLEVDNALSIGFHKRPRTSMINSLAASAGIRGNKKDIVFDEFAHIEGADELFYAALPAIINGDLGVDLVSTPRGRHNMFADIFLNEPNQRGEYAYSDFSRHQFIWVDVQRFVTDYEGVQKRWYIDYEQNMNRMDELVDEFGSPKLKLLRMQYPLDIFKQEFCGVFLDDTYSVFPFSLVDKCLKGSVGSAEGPEGIIYEEEYLEPWYDKRPEGNTNVLIMGVDFANTGSDKTSIQILEKTKDGKLKHRYSRNLDKSKFSDLPAQAEEIARVAVMFEVNKIVADNTGMGQGVVPLIKRMIPSVHIEPVDFNTTNKEQMVVNLKLLMEQGDVWIMEEEKQLQAEIYSIQADQLPSGKIRYHGEPHDDMFWAFAMAAKEGTYKHFAMYTIDSLVKMQGR